ncbi:MAG TPA: hypothetical protein DDY37_02680, partial [Legionella sp.]|nr:hypothetical protein [Legionella sp.]
TRLAQLKQTLLASDDFMAYFNQHGHEATAQIKKEIQAYMTTAKISEADQTAILSKIHSTYTQLREIAYKKDDYSPLIKEMKWDCYSFSTHSEPSMHDIIWVQNQFEFYKKIKDDPNAFKYASILEHLVDQYEKRPQVEIKTVDRTNIPFSRSICSHYKIQYLAPQKITTFEQFKEAADKIRACDLPLKQQKNELLAVLKNARLDTPALNSLKKELETPIQDDPSLSSAKKILRNALGHQAPKDPSLKFINQLRSNLWFIRDLRGTYGTTATSAMMIEEIDKKLSIARTQIAREKLADATKQDATKPLTPPNLTT